MSNAQVDIYAIEVNLFKFINVLLFNLLFTVSQFIWT